MRWLINSAVIPAGAYGKYEFSPLTRADARLWLESGLFLSRIGYQSTADFIRTIADVDVPLSRDPSELKPGDEALVVRLKYRVDPEKKGQAEPSPEDFEIGLLKRLS